MNLSELINSIDIVAYISQFVDLTEKGGEYWGISPFTHPPEKTPSFSVRGEANRWYDFSSGLGGNVFTFAKHYFNCTSSEAVEKLKEYAGVKCDLHITQRLTATSVCKKYMPTKKAEKHGSTSCLRSDIMQHYEYDPEKFKIWIDEGISLEAIQHFQVRYDMFQDRLVYPVFGVDGKIMNIGARTLDPKWKEKGLRKYTYIYPWNGSLSTVYGVFENIEGILTSGEIVLFEGAKSVMKAWSWGIRNTGAILTSHLNPFQLMILLKLGCRVVFALDKDVDISKDYNIMKLKRFLNVQFIRDDDGLLDEKDAPVDKGEEVFRKLYSERRRLI